MHGACGELSTQMADDLRDKAVGNVTVRTYSDQDHPVVTQLYTDGLLAGQLDSNDTGADIENIREAYLEDEANHFWVAVADGKVVGMIGVSSDEGHTGEIRRLRVLKPLQSSGIAARLVETAVAHCRKLGFLKVRLDTRFESGAAQHLFERFGFHHTRTKNVESKDLLEFYLDLYREPDEKA